MLLKLYVNGRRTLPEIINFFCNLFQFAKINVTNFDQSPFFPGKKYINAQF